MGEGACFLFKTHFLPGKLHKSPLCSPVTVQDPEFFLLYLYIEKANNGIFCFEREK